MPLVNAPIETYKELQFLLKIEESFLLEKNYLNATFKVGERDKTFLTSVGLNTLKDFIDANDEQINQLFSKNELYQFVLEGLADINKEYVHSFVKNNCLLAPIQALKIIQGDDYRFLNRPINIYLYPRLASRLKKAMDKVNIVNYVDLKHFVNSGPMIDIRGVGLDCLRALHTIIISDYRYLKSNRMLRKKKTITKEKTTLKLFEELLNESWEMLNKKWDLSYLQKWKYTKNALKDDATYTLKRLYGKKNAAIIINSFYDGFGGESTEMMAYYTNYSFEKIEYAETVLRRRYLSAFTKEKLINDPKENRANVFYKRIIKLGKNEIAPFLGLLMWLDPVYSVILDDISKAFPSIGKVLENIKAFMESFASIAEA